MKSALERMGWSQANFGRRLGVHVNTVTNWAQAPEIPSHVAEYLRVCELARQMLERP